MNSAFEQSPKGSPFLPDGRVQCKHGQVIRLRQCRSGANVGRTFYSCFKDRNDPNNCKFFKWTDEIDDATNVAAEPGSPRWHPVRELSEPPMYTLFAPTPKKRQREGTPTTPTASPQCSQSVDQGCEIGSTHSTISTSSKRHKAEINGENGGPVAGSSTHRFVSQSLSVDPEENPFLSHSTPFVPASPKNNSSSDEGEIDNLGHRLTTLIRSYKKVKNEKLGAERARDAQAARITELEKQVAQLKELVRSLQKQNEIYHGLSKF